LLLLQKEFPLLKSYTLPSYHIKYTKSSKYLKLKLLLSVPAILNAVKKEQKVVAKIMKEEQISGIISDNRFGVYHSNIPTVYISHQLTVLSGTTTFITSKIHQKCIKKFTECWVPDSESKQNLSGKLGHLNRSSLNIKYIGALSRFKKQETALKYDLMVLLSGPEPQRTLLENKLLFELKQFKGTVLFVRGIISEEQLINARQNFKIVNYYLSDDLEIALNQSKVIISRSGYSTMMDFAAVGKKAFFIPTPGQFEQEYLAEICEEKGIAPFSNQNDFRLADLKKTASFTGFHPSATTLDFRFFQLFHGK
jgi:hypothetical protein